MLKAKMHKYRQFVKLTCWMLLSFMTTLALTMEFGLPDYMDVDFTVSSEWLVNLEKSLTVDAFKSSVVFLFTLLVSKIIEYVNQDRIKFSEYKIFYLICLMIGIVWLMAKSFVINNSLTNIYETTGQIVKSIIYYIGTVNLLIFIGKAIFLFADSQCSKPLHDSESNKETKKSGYRTFLFLIALWIPHLVIAYPASIISDAWSQLSMFYGRKIFTSHHPPFHTLVIGMAVKMGEKMGSANMGLFLFIVAQSILFALVISYGITTMKKMDSPKWLIRLTLFIAVTSPYYTAYIGLITKDTLYSYFFLLFIIELIYERIIPRGGYWKNTKHNFLFVVSAVMVILFRNNGKYIIYPMLIVLICVLWKDGVLFYSKQHVMRIVIPMILVLFIPFIINLSLNKLYQIEKGSIKEMLSLPFQQTARYVANHADEVTDEEQVAINRILDYDSLAGNYNPILSDLVKNTFKENSTREDKVEYIKVWLHQFKEHPMTYISATINQNYRLIYPTKISYLYLETYKDRGELAKILGIEEVEAIKQRESNLKNYYNIMFKLPLVGLLSMVAFYNLILLYLLIYITYKKIKQSWIIAMPLIISDFIIVAGPLVHPRYAFPIIYSMPIMIAFSLFAMKNVHLRRTSNDK